MPAPTDANLRPPRWGFFKGLLTGLVIEVPAIAGAVWVLAQLGFGDPDVGFMRLLRFTTVFAGFAAVLTAAGIGRLAAHASVQSRGGGGGGGSGGKLGGRRRAVFVAARAHAAAGAGLVVIAAIPHGHLPDVRWHWLALLAGGAVCGALCGAVIGVVCGGATTAFGGVVALARRPTEVLRAILAPEELVKLGAAVRTRTTGLFEGLFDPAPPAPAVPAAPAGAVSPAVAAAPAGTPGAAAPEAKPADSGPPSHETADPAPVTSEDKA
nr:hypothetical protein [Kofleriaceae bacterium]